MNEKLRNAAEKAAKKDVILILENEAACNTATAAEAGKVLSAVSSPNLMLNWDPGNAAERDEKPIRMDTISCQRIALATVIARMR